MSNGAKDIQAIVFDLDGTLWDARDNICKSWNVSLKQNYPQVGELTPDMFTAQMGKVLDDIGDELFSQLPVEDRRRAVKLCCEEENRYLAVHGAHLFEDEQSTIRRLCERYKLYIVSNCQDGYIEAFLNSCGFKHCISDYECIGRSGRSKGENIRMVMERNGIERAVYIGDTALDRQAAELAGVPFIWAAYGFGSVENYAAKAESFSEIPDACRNVDLNVQCTMK